jgi:TPR repeat protein
MRMSRLLQGRDGFWSSIENARKYLERAANAGDSVAKIDLAELLIADNESRTDQQKAVDLLTQTVKSDGDVRAVENLVRFYRCIDPNARNEAYWSNIKNAMGNDTTEVSADEATSLDPSRDSKKIAALQTQSLYGRGSAMAVFRRYLSQKPDAEASEVFWTSRVNEAPNGVLEEIYAEYKLNIKAGRIALARLAIKPVNNDYNPDAGLIFARFLYEHYPNDQTAMELTRQILLPLAEKGFGRAIQFIVVLDQNKQITDFLGVMKSRGDMVSLLILAEMAQTEDERQLYLRRAEGFQRCDFNDAMTLGEYSLRLNPGHAEKWLETAIRLADSNQWLKVKIADLYMSASQEKATKRALELYRAGHDARENSASYRLVKYYSDKARKDYNPRMASDIFVDLIKRSDLKDVPERLLMLKNMKEEVRRQVTLRVNVTAIYEKAAAARQPVAMREYGKILRSAGGKTQQSFNLFLGAANLNDAESMFLVSQSYAFGIGVEASEQQAHTWLNKAAESGFPEAVKLHAYLTGASQG